MADIMYAWQLIDDPSIAAKVKAVAADAPPGSEKAIKAFDDATRGLDFDSSDGTKADMYNGKSLDAGAGGRTQFLRDKLEVAGKTAQEASQIAGGHYTNIVKAYAADQGQADAPLSAKISAWKAAHGGVRADAGTQGTKVVPS